MKNEKLKVARPIGIKRYGAWFLLTGLGLLVVIGLAVCVDIRLLGLSFMFLLPFLYLVYDRFYFSKCELRLDDSEHRNPKLMVVTPLAVKVFPTADVHFTVKKMGFRSASYIITIRDASGKKIFRLDTSYWDHVPYMLTLPHKSTPITRELQGRWR